MTREKGIGYIRVSTVGQAEDGYGLDAQEADVRRCARACGLQLIGIVRDEGVSGTVDADSRLGLAEALATIENGEAEALVVARLDRLARKLTIQEAALAHVWKLGGRVYACDQGGEVPKDDPDDPMRTAMRQMMGVFAQLDRAMVVARLRRGRRAKAEQGGRPSGRSPYGWRAERGELVAVPEEQAAIGLARTLRGQDRSLRQIAVTLDEAGHRPKGGGVWHPIQVRRLIG
jgi:DNA invertase Pin-like site-specific DNA recombinase